MNMLEITGFLSDTAKNEKDKSAVSMKQKIEGLVDSEGGKLLQFEVEKGVAFVVIHGDAAQTSVTREFNVAGVTVKPMSAIARDQEKNKRRQEKAYTMRKSAKERKEKLAAADAAKPADGGESSEGNATA